MSDEKNNDGFPIVEEEQRLLEVVLATLVRLQNSKEKKNYDADLLALRDALNEEKLADDQAAILEQMDRLSALSSARAAFTKGVVNRESPYFAHMRIEDDERGRRDILLGKQTFVGGGIRIVDWRNAPISKVFYQTRENESFDAHIAGRDVSGEVTLRRTVTISKGELRRVNAPAGSFIHTHDGWKEINLSNKKLAGGERTAARPDTAQPILGSPDGLHDIREDKHLTEIAALLDGEQFKLITRPDSGLVAIQGSAGSGKTTVGLHRLAYLNFHKPSRFRSQRMMIMVFSEALARYISYVLPALGVKGVNVRTLRVWAAKIRRAHFPGLPTDRAEDTPASVVRLKTHRCLIPMLEEATENRQNARPVEFFDHLFTDRYWLRRGTEKHAPGAFTDNEIREIHRWCSDQQSGRFEDPEEHDGFRGYDYEDDMILLRLYQLLKGSLMFGKDNPVRYDHLMVDEAQDFSPLELLVLLDTARERSITLAGDTAQKIKEENDFSDWSDVLEAIGHDHVNVSPLNISYRSTREIMALAHHILGPLAPTEMPDAPRNGAPVEHFQFGGQGEAMTFLADALSELFDREPSAGVAVLTRFPHQADEAYAALHRADIPRLERVREQDFSFGPGIEVTDIAQTKGLEFDYVILLQVDKDSFPPVDASRHLLHVGVTRAAHQVWMFSWGAPSPLLPDDLQTREMG